MCDTADQPVAEQQQSLQEMFQEGMTSIAVHRKENVFQELDKRTLSKEEEAVIQRRVEHQRKMYELFEKRERQRKIEELKEVCPDLSEEEACRALDYCKGNEEEAAASLVSDPSFRRRVLDPGSHAYQSSGPRRSKRSDTWHAKPDGARPKVVDRASLEGTIFVGAFRGKGFQGNGAGRKVVMRKLTEMQQSADAKTSAETEVQTDSAPENNENVKEDSRVDSEEVRPKKEALEDPAPLSQNGETPKSVPKAYALVKEDSDGTIRPLTTSEIERVELIEDTPKTVKSKKRLSEGEMSPRLTRRKPIEPPAEAPLSATRRSSRQRTMRPIDPGLDPNADAHLDVVKKSSDADAAKYLRKLPKTMAAYVLETLGTIQPENAVNIRELLDAPEEEKSPEYSTEATVSVQIVEETTGSTPSSKKKPKAAKPVVKNVNTRPSAARSAAERSVAASVISARGHTNRGRVKQKSHKSAELVHVGTLRAQKGWYNAGYIFPEGFKSRTLFRSSVALDSLCVHECDVIGQGGMFWPAPTFRVVALDRPDEPLIAKSCTGCWTAVLKRINAEIEARRAAGEDLPPPPRTAIAGPEYFGFNQPDIVDAVEALDEEQACFDYWTGKAVRQEAAAGLPPSERTKVIRRPKPVTERFTKQSRRGRASRNARPTSPGILSGEEDDDEAQFMSSKWSAVSRTERYRNRLQENGDEEAALKVDSDNPLPDFMDPITLEPVIRPAISPFGHVMGAATWKAVLAEQGVCPFTKKPLRWEQCRILTKANIDAYKDSIIQ